MPVVWSPDCPAAGSPALAAPPPRQKPKVRIPYSPHCPGCLCEHDSECNVIGVTRGVQFRLSLVVSTMLCPNISDDDMFPWTLARLHSHEKPLSKKPPNRSESILNALRNAKELAQELGHSVLMGWPLWWLEQVVLEYCARPDGISISDALMDKSVPAFRFVQHTRKQCFERLASSFALYSHHGMCLPTALECSTHRIPLVLAFDWPSAISHVILNKGRVAAVCSQNGILWIADTGCGYHLVPECDIVRGRSSIVDNPGAQKLHTANGEVTAPECVQFSLTEINLSKQLGTILPETPRVLSVGALCMDELATFHWPAGPPHRWFV